MDPKPSTSSIKDDVLQSTDHSRLTPEEIAKAIAHHNRHHPKEKLEMSAKSGAGKSPGSKKGK
jgi:hypothetical protein